MVEGGLISFVLKLILTFDIHKQIIYTLQNVLLGRIYYDLSARVICGYTPYHRFLSGVFGGNT